MKHRFMVVLGICILVQLLWLVPVGVAQSVGSAAVDRPLDAADVATFIDDVMSAHFQAYPIPGATVAVVKDGEIRFARGYGYADLDNETPVDASSTLLRVGSISKLFPWTAVMQLVEQGLLDLHEDINTYLAGSEVSVP